MAKVPETLYDVKGVNAKAGNQTVDLPLNGKTNIVDKKGKLVGGVYILTSGNDIYAVKYTFDIPVEIKKTYFEMDAKGKWVEDKGFIKMGFGTVEKLADQVESMANKMSKTVWEAKPETGKLGPWKELNSPNRKNPQPLPLPQTVYSFEDGKKKIEITVTPSKDAKMTVYEAKVEPK